MQRKNKVWPLDRRKAVDKSAPEEAQILDLLDNTFKAALLSMLKEPQEARSKD